MPTIPIPADKVAIVPGTQYQLTELVAAKRYVFKVNTDRPVEVLITKEEAGTTVQASGRLYNREVAFTTDAGQTSAYFTVIGLSEAKVTLSMIQKDAPAIGPLPSPARPDLWYNAPNALTPGSVYKITCSDPMATVLLRFMDDSLNNVVAEATPLLPGWDAVFVTAVNANLQVLLDGVSPAVITIVQAQVLPCATRIVQGAVSGASTDFQLPAGMPAGAYAVDVSVPVATGATTWDAKLTVGATATVITSEVLGATSAASGLVPLVPSGKVLTGNQFVGRLIFSIGAPTAAATTMVTIAKASTGSNPSGTLVFSYLGPLA
nr:MAG: hypothetical protein [Bacteriophage sp.]